MAFGHYRSNVQALCDKLKLPNPVREEDIRIESVKFFNHLQIGPKTISVQGSEMNRAGRLFIQTVITGDRGFIDQNLQVRAQRFFTPELWDDCGPEKRPLVFGFKISNWIEIFFKH